MSDTQNAILWSALMVMWAVCWAIASNGQSWGLALTLSPVAVALARHFCERRE